VGALTSEEPPARRATLSREPVLRGAIAFADTNGIESLSMRGLAQGLGVVPMALYKHVANKEDLLDGMIELVVGDIGGTPGTGLWKPDVRQRILAARRSLLHHPWARAVLESRTAMTPAMLDYLNALTGLFLTGGLSVDLTHHVMHALGNRMWGFSQELFAATPASDTESFAAQRQALPAHHPHLATIAMAAAHGDPGSGIGPGCDDQAEFEFALDLLLDGVEVLHADHWTPKRDGRTHESARGVTGEVRQA
jgi:AcrR family transcriptional regulator